MSLAPVSARVWHPVSGVAVVLLPCLAAVLLTGTGAGAGWAGASAFLAMGAVAGFAVSGST